MPGPSKRAAAQPTEGEDSSSPRKRSRASMNGTQKTAPKGGDDANTSSLDSKSKQKKSPAKKKAGGHQCVTERVPLRKLWTAEKAASRGSYSKSDCIYLLVFVRFRSSTSGFLNVLWFQPTASHPGTSMD
jgi:hypothetical protein